MRPCESCGFESPEPGRPCPLCGATERSDPAQEQSTRAAPPHPAAFRGGKAPVLAVGTVFDDRYRVEALLGRGGMGQVYRVHDASSGQLRALKVMQPLADEDADLVARFRREIRLLDRVRHPAVVRVLDWRDSPSGMFLVTELVDGEDLKTAIRRHGSFTAAEAAALGATLAEALAAAHAQGIVHRDVKPGNVMIARDGSVKLLDFGLARGVGIDITSLTRTGMILGTPSYMSPEQFDGRGVDELSDIYSLGVVLYELASGRLPFQAPTPVAVALAHKTEPPRSLRLLRGGVPAWFDRIVLQCLEKDPSRRFASASELAAALRHPHEGRPRRRDLSTGDRVIEDPGQTTDWTLVVEAPKEKAGWIIGQALRFEDRYYRLEDCLPPDSSGAPWTYRFVTWPEGEVFRRLVDYDQDCAERASAESRRLKQRLGRWLGRDQ